MNIRAFLDEDFIYKALLISLTAHLLFVCSSLFVPAHSRAVHKVKKIEISYKAVTEPIRPTVPQPKEPEKKISRQDPLNAAVLIKERDIAPESLKVVERTPIKSQVLSTAMKKTVSVPLLESEKINNPSYQNYYSLVRARIRQKAYFNYAEYYAGEVYLTFVLNNDGTLKDLKIIEEKSSGGPYLRTIGLKSIKEATPFPPFPKALNYPELTFNVVISFQVHDQP